MGDVGSVPSVPLSMCINPFKDTNDDSRCICLKSTTSKHIPETINIIHFNDAYKITPEICKDKHGNIVSIKGGASRFKSFIDTLSPLKPIVLFSGDFLSPSNMSTATGGSHMIPIFNEFGITCACLGNHELDKGNEHCIEMLSKLNYPTLNCNQLTPTNGSATGDMEHDLKLDLEPLGKCKQTFVYSHTPNFNIGFIGISEPWAALIQPTNGLLYLDFIEECRKKVHELKQKHKIDLMIALTHSRLSNDQLLASEVEGIDLILGGHDHIYHCGMDSHTKTMILKSGSDFHNISWLQIRKQNADSSDPLTQKIDKLLSKSLNEKKGVFVGKKYNFINRYYNIDMNIKPDAKIEKLVHDLTASFEQKVNQTIGYIAGPLDVRESVVRSRESAAGNFTTDVIRRAYHCDAVIINGSMLRANRIIAAGAITTKDLLDIDAFQNVLMVVKMRGDLLLEVLEKVFTFGCPQISGMRFIYDDKEQIGNRIKKVWISRYKESDIHSFHKSLQNLKSADTDAKSDDEDALELLDEDALYTISMTDFLYHNGLRVKWETYKHVEVIIDQESGLSMSIILRNFFWAINTVNELLKLSKDKDDESTDAMMNRFAIKPQQRRNSMLRMDAYESLDEIKSNNVLTVTPRMEQRILTVDQEVDLESDEFGSLYKWFKRLPSFAGLTKLPRQQSLLQILQEVDDIEKTKQSI